MVIVETSVFTRQVQKLLKDDDYRELQIVLAERPDMGAVMVGSGGTQSSVGGSGSRQKRRCTGDVLLGGQTRAVVNVTDVSQIRAG